MKELGYECKQPPFDELESRSEELKVLGRKLAAGGIKQTQAGKMSKVELDAAFG